MKNVGFAGLFLLFTLLIAGGASADPRDDALSAVLRCSGMSDKAQRLVCYDSAAVRVPGALRISSPPVAAPVATPVASSAAAPVPAPPVVAHRRRNTGFMARLFGSGGPNRTPQTTVAQFGSESIANGGTHAYPIPMDEDTIDEITAHVTSYDLSTGYLVVTLDNGQVWRQVAGDPVGHLERQAAAYSAIISRGSSGAYDLKLSHFGHTVPVRRIR